jgi:stage III sporulation protein AD
MQIAAVGVLCAILAITVKKHSPEIALIISIAASILIFTMVLPLLTDLMGTMDYVSTLLDGRQQYISIAIRVIGVAYIAELAASVCHDAGESAIATKVELAGRIIILVMATPVLRDLINILVGIMP